MSGVVKNLAWMVNFLLALAAFAKGPLLGTAVTLFVLGEFRACYKIRTLIQRFQIDAERLAQKNLKANHQPMTPR